MKPRINLSTSLQLLTTHTHTHTTTTKGNVSVVKTTRFENEPRIHNSKVIMPPLYKIKGEKELLHHHHLSELRICEFWRILENFENFQKKIQKQKIKMFGLEVAEEEIHLEAIPQVLEDPQFGWIVLIWWIYVGWILLGFRNGHVERHVERRRRESQ